MALIPYGRPGAAGPTNAMMPPGGAQGGMYGVPGGMMGGPSKMPMPGGMMGGAPMKQPMPAPAAPPPQQEPSRALLAGQEGTMSPQMQAGLRLGGGLLGAMQQQPGQRMGGLLGRAMLDPTMLQALQQMSQGWGRKPVQPGMPNMNAMGPGGMLGGRV